MRKPLWKHYADGVLKLKVEGGYLYRTADYDENDIASNVAMVLVPSKNKKVCLRCVGIESSGGKCDECGRTWGKESSDYKKGYNDGWRDAGLH